MKTVTIKNKVFEAKVSDKSNGQMVFLKNNVTGRIYVDAMGDDGILAEGGHKPFTGLQCWIKSGTITDPNTFVLSGFSKLHGAEGDIDGDGKIAVFESSKNGLRFRIEWDLSDDANPLECRAVLKNENSEEENFQYECFFIWSFAQEKWEETAFFIPGMEPRLMEPYGEIWFGTGEGVDAIASAEVSAGMEVSTSETVIAGTETSPSAEESTDGGLPAGVNQPAIVWRTGTKDGIAMIGSKNICRYFAGVQAHELILGPHSEPKKLSRGETLQMGFRIAPAEFAVENGWGMDLEKLEKQISERKRERQKIITSIGSLKNWVDDDKKNAIEKRAFHLTAQYKPVEKKKFMELLEKVVIPGGYNILMIEVDRAFKYKSHPEIAPDWAWNKQEWRELVRSVKSCGIDVVAHYNSLGHQGESGLALAHEDMREDKGGHCLNPLHPKSIPYLCEIYDELIDAFECKQFHIGLDEIDMPSRPQTFLVSESCRGKDGGKIFGDFANALCEHLKKQKQEVYIWADMLLYKPEHGTANGLRTGTWKAIDALPKDIIMIDWEYGVMKDYGGTKYLTEKGFRVMGATWHDPKAVAVFSKFAKEYGMYGMCQTTWGGPEIKQTPMKPVVIAGKYFNNPFAGPYEKISAEAEAIAYNIADIDGD